MATTDHAPGSARAEDEDFSAATLRALAKEARAKGKDNMGRLIPLLKAHVQTSVREQAKLGHLYVALIYDRAAVARVCQCVRHSDTLCLTLGERLSNAVVASWFPGCRTTHVLVDVHSIDFHIWL